MRHDPRTDAAAISHHYDAGNEFYALVLGPTMVYSCAYWTEPPSAGFGLDEAQRAKLDLVCRKLALTPGQRLLDVGCGWGGLVVHAAREYGVRAVGVTLSREQADFARSRVHAAGLDGRVEIRRQDYRAVDDGPYDAVASVGMAEHVGARQFGVYAEQARRYYDHHPQSAAAREQYWQCRRAWTSAVKSAKAAAHERQCALLEDPANGNVFWRQWACQHSRLLSSRPD